MSVSYPHLIVGDFNLYHPLTDPLRSLSNKEYTLSALYLESTFDAPYHLLNIPRIYTRFPFDPISRSSVLDLAFPNTALSLFVFSWDPPLPSTGSDHVPINVTLQPRAIKLRPHTPHGAVLNGTAVKDAVVDFTIRPCPTRVTANALARWVTYPQPS